MIFVIVDIILLVLMYNAYMGWETDRHGKSRYVQKIRVGKKVTSKVLGVGEVGLAAEQALLQKRKESQQFCAELDFSSFLADTLEKSVNSLIVLEFVLGGMIQRNGRWQAVSKLKKPLTPVERAYVMSMKRRARYQRKKAMLQTENFVNADSNSRQIPKNDEQIETHNGPCNEGCIRLSNTSF